MNTTTADAELVARLRRAGPFRELDAAAIERLASNCTRRRFGAGDYVWRRGDAAQYIIVVEEGIVAIQRTTAEGEGVLVALFGPGDTLCVVPALQHIPLPADAVAVTECAQVLAVAAAPALSDLDHHPQLMAAFNRALLEHTSSLRRKIDIVSAGTVPRRVATLLLYLAERFGRTSADGVVQIDPALTREQIGQLVDARTETVIRVMSKWSKAGWIHGAAPALQLLRTDMLQRIARGGAGVKASGA